ncbi:unnamed protein product [Brachionus calyciflorus]|uniref:Epoxide hydrolase n=1 Tax=Brachionus calyciflorus TaxID=104777 RepID=A0A813NTB4_9BILA|nr:unnamed protein product [Brachionus calyciflorus]
MTLVKAIGIPVLLIALLIGLVKYQNRKSLVELERIEKWADENKFKVDKILNKPEIFSVEFDEKEWNFLKQKLSLTRYFTPLKDVPKFDYGFDPEYAKELIDYWNTKFDWKSQVDFLNKYPQFRVNINDTILHYVHYVTNPSAEKKVNLLLLDGWPGSFFGFYKMIDFIDQNYKDTSYNIIVPSIPGYGYSNPTEKVLDAFDTAMFYDAIMRLENGENTEYYVHGEDWGSIITTYLAKLYPKRVRAIHITMPPFTSFFDLKSLSFALVGQFFPESILTPDEAKYNFRFSFSEILTLIIKKAGYFHIQASKPDSMGAGMSDSPFGLLSYVLEKYSLGSFGFNQTCGTRDGLLEKLGRDELLTIITYYWMTNCITSSMRLYRNTFYTLEKGWPRTVLNNLIISEKVPVAVQLFRYEVSFVPFKVLEQKYLNLVRYNIVEDGGHFASFENPQKSAVDFIDFIKNL